MIFCDGKRHQPDIHVMLGVRRCVTCVGEAHPHKLNRRPRPALLLQERAGHIINPCAVICFVAFNK